MNIFKKTAAALSTLTLLAGMTACAAENEVGTVTYSERIPSLAPVVYNESDIADAIGLDENNYVTTPDGVKCAAAVILTSASEVAMYADAGDTVATNPAGTAGVKNVSSETATCQTFFEEKLATL